jgi:hypothetical protein
VLPAATVCPASQWHRTAEQRNEYAAVDGPVWVVSLPFRPISRLAEDEERRRTGVKREEEEEWGKKKWR